MTSEIRKCEHYWEIYEWEMGYYSVEGFVRHEPNKTADISPIRKATKVICKKCLEVREVL